ncbi:MAG: Crp/Fnr family transcriptional regulator [Pricia sp.]
MKEVLYHQLSQVFPLTQEEFEPIAAILQVQTYKKGDRILDFGQVERRTNMVISGSVHQYIFIDGEAFTIDISLSGMYFNNYKSYLEETPSIETQEALTDTEVLYMEKKDSEKLLLESHSFCYIYMKSWEQTHLEREKRSWVLQNKNANKRFELFMTTNKNAKRYLEEVSQKKIAEYLSLSPETFSRVKKAYFLNN